MYLQKAPNGVYQTRICIPKLLREFGYPFDIKVSLLTKERSDAIERNFKTASCIKGALSLIDHNQPPLFSVFKATLDKRIEALRFSFTSTAGQSYSKIFEAPPELMEHFQNDIYTDLPSEVDLTNLEETDPEIKSVPTKVIPFSKLLERFLESKK
ncbi:integrase, partial [Vibrio parahaemolyticus]